MKVFNAKKKVVGSKKVTVKGGKSKTVHDQAHQGGPSARSRRRARSSTSVRFSAKDAAGNGAAIAKKFTLRA